MESNTPPENGNLNFEKGEPSKKTTKKQMSMKYGLVKNGIFIHQWFVIKQKTYITG